MHVPHPKIGLRKNEAAGDECECGVWVSFETKPFAHKQGRAGENVVTIYHNAAMFCALANLG